ncbi:GTPase IMAP family member 9-like isoform X3 [Esox lucius]|uniref:GTPase IMAP family member 9-like isoform X3 n=1 Tax=Esox lucius TaxID=8010 RepID=UPI00147690C1|nr:GTPase IMAP family member 9-like isoform X3 [Esox lucius]
MNTTEPASLSTGAMASEHAQKVYGSPPQSELRLVLLGRIGAGKSTVVKTILGRDKFRSEGVTCVKKQGEVAGRTVIIVDTPGWDSVKHTSKHIQEEIKNSVILCPPGPHALLLVVPMGDQLSSSARKAIQYHIELLSVRAWKYTMVLFVSDAEEKCTYNEQNQMLERANSILVKCGERHFHFEVGNSTTQVTELLKKIDAMVAENYEDFFIPQVYYELLESKIPREVTELIRMSEDRVSRLEQRYKRELKEKDEQLSKYREAEKATEMLKRTDSMNTETQERTGMQKGKTDQQTVALQAIKQGYREEALSVVQHYVKPLMVIITSVLGALIGAVAGAQHGTLGACVGIPVGIVVAVLGSYAVRGAATAARDVPGTVSVKGPAVQNRDEGKPFYISSPSAFNKDQ